MKFCEALEKLLANKGSIIVKDQAEEVWELKDLLDEEVRAIDEYGETSPNQKFAVDNEGIVEISNEYNRKRWVRIIEESEVESIARKIRESEKWNLDLLAELCELAGLSSEWEAANGENFEELAQKAADIIDVKLF